MIEQVTLRYFKVFQEETFDISDSIILAGPNNTGKTTLLQAIAAWNLALHRWLTERGPESGSKASKRTGVAISRKDFTAIPLREMNLLWTDRSTALRKYEVRGDQKPGMHRVLHIGVKGKDAEGEWDLALEFSYGNPHLIYARPAKETPVEPVLEAVRDLQVVHVPPFSGIGAEETGYDKAYQDLLIGQGKPGDILRNLLLEVHREKPDEWGALCKDITDMFGYHLLPPVYEGRPFIICEYQPGIPGRQSGKSLPKLDISCAGSGFLQVLMLLGFFYARPASILLLDEPDAHLHVVLQKQVYDRLREISRRHGCQLLIATHSEVLVDGTSPERIVSFFDHPHRLVADTDRNQVREALKRLTSLDILLAEQSPGILYVEGETDLNLLREWARVLEHPAYQFLAEPFWHSNQGRHPREARSHFFALKAVKPNIRGILIDREILTEGLTLLRWKRYEAENYLLHPQALARFVSGPTPDFFTHAGQEYLRERSSLIVDDDYQEGVPASKTLLPGFFEAASVSLTKNEYYQVAAQMLPEEIPREVREKLDVICETFDIGENVTRMTNHS
jgi:predicted ATPase